MEITSGQHQDILKHFPNYNIETSEVWAEAGLDNGKTFRGAFVAKLRMGESKRGTMYRFEDGALDMAYRYRKG
jgi:hypothetical protein